MSVTLTENLVETSTNLSGLRASAAAHKKIGMARTSKIRPEDVQAIADRLRALRISTGLTQTEFAAEYGFSQTQWANFEAAISRIGIDAALVLQSRLKTPLDWIYVGETAWLPSGLKEKIAGVEPRALKRAGGSSSDLS